jgi:hypothetical protein
MTRPLIVIFAVLSIFGLFITLLQSCNKQYSLPEIANEPERITSVQLELRDIETGKVNTYIFQEIDSSGVRNDTVRLQSNSSYYCSLKFLNEVEPNEISNITYQIKKDSKNHIICFDTKTTLYIIRTDNDGMLPLGLESKWYIGEQSQGRLTIGLMHQPNIKNGSCEIGETDIKIAFPILIN